MPRVLIVEDNEMNLDMLSRRLTRQGFEVVTAVDGPAGVDMARATRPDLILMDVALGPMDGWEATTLIKSDPLTRTIPVIALTAHALASDRRKSLDVGCVDFDTKPIDFARLMGKIRQALGAPQTA